MSNTATEKANGQAIREQAIESLKNSGKRKVSRIPKLIKQTLKQKSILEEREKGAMNWIWMGRTLEKPNFILNGRFHIPIVL